MACLRHSIILKDGTTSVSMINQTDYKIMGKETKVLWDF